MAATRAERKQERKTLPAGLTLLVDLHGVGLDVLATVAPYSSPHRVGELSRLRAAIDKAAVALALAAIAPDAREATAVVAEATETLRLAIEMVLQQAVAAELGDLDDMARSSRYAIRATIYRGEIPSARELTERLEAIKQDLTALAGGKDTPRFVVYAIRAKLKTYRAIVSLRRQTRPSYPSSLFRLTINIFWPIVVVVVGEILTRRLF